MSSRFSPIFITGPTASGKSAVAVRVAEALGGEIVNVDAFQLYAGMDLLTAKPSAEEQQRVPHHLYGVLPLTETCDAQRYRDLALPVMADIAARGRVPLIVGGSGLYLKALSHGLAPLPPADPELRARLALMTADEKRTQLLHLDPDAAQNVPLANPRYVDRALEVCLLTGQPQSKLRQTFAGTPPAGPGVLIEWPRELLYQRIDQRVHAMVQAGLLEEVAHLPAVSATAEKAIGLRDIRAHLAGQVSLAEAIAAMQQATRQYAKRQITWFRRESWLQTICLDSQSTAECALPQILSHLSCPPQTSLP